MLCYNCFKEYEGTVCPHCGYDSADDAGRYPHALKAGTILNGYYILGRVIGQGGFGITYLAQDFENKEIVAIKEYLPEELSTRAEGSYTVIPFSGDREENFNYGKECFLEEAKTLAEFRGNQNIVSVSRYFEENGTAYLVMEYIKGIGLDEYIRSKGGKISVEEANELLLPIMDALGWVHSKGVIHRDIAPDNIIITEDGTAKLIDFGAARYSMGEKSRSLDVILKHGFAPVEQYTRRGRQGAYTDVYALAATYYYAITGEVLPDSVERMDEDRLVPPSEFGIEISSEEEKVLLKALSVKSQDRFSSMHEFHNNLLKAIRIKEEQRKILIKKRQKRVFALFILIALAALFPLTLRITAKKAKYNEAIELMDSGAYEKAISAFESIDEYMDCRERIEQCDWAIKDKAYEDAIAIMENGAYENAIRAFENLDGYKDSENQIIESKYLWAGVLTEEGRFVEACELYNEMLDYKDSSTLIEKVERLSEWTTIGGVVKFGLYEQDNNPADGKEEIEWIVLATEGEKALVISKYGLEKKAFNIAYQSAAWENSSIRKWLNEDFYSEAFNEMEQSKILNSAVVNNNPEYRVSAGNNTEDKLFLLNREELELYILSNTIDNLCFPTKHAVANGVWEYPDRGDCYWWLRTPGHSIRYAVTVCGDFIFTYGEAVGNGGIAVRPAMWINLEP